MNGVAVAQMEPLAREATSLLKALAHPARLMICCQLMDGEMSVGTLESTLGIRQPGLSRELARLRDDGLLATRRESRAVFYRLDDDRVRHLIQALCGVMLDDAAEGRLDAGENRAPEISGAASVSTNDDFSRATGAGVFARVGPAAGGKNS